MKRWEWEDNIIQKRLSDLDIIEEYKEWCEENCNSEWNFSSELFGVEAHAYTMISFEFYDHDDAMAFMLTWGFEK